MARRSTPERIYQIRRVARVNRLISVGWVAEQVEAAIVAWEAQGSIEGRNRREAAFWDGAEPWAIEWMGRNRHS